MDAGEVFVLLGMFTIPLTAIIGYYNLKRRKLELEKLKIGLGPQQQLSQGGQQGLELEMTVRRLDAENAQLRKRLENLEAVVSTAEWDEVNSYRKPKELTD